MVEVSRLGDGPELTESSGGEIFLEMTTGRNLADDFTTEARAVRRAGIEYVVLPIGEPGEERCVRGIKMR